MCTRFPTEGDAPSATFWEIFVCGIMYVEMSCMWAIAVIVTS